MKKITILTIIIITILSLCFNAYALDDMTPSSKSSILIDGISGTVLYDKNSDEKLPPASITKVMTMLLAIEALEEGIINYNDQVRISEYASSMGGSQLFLEPNEIRTVEELLIGIAVSSANDAAVAIGEHIGGTNESFIQLMNDRAKELGLTNTQFKNATGLPAEGHYSTARDIAILSKELMSHKGISDLLSIWMTTLNVGLENNNPIEISNTNRLIRFYDGANGVKTGFTNEAMFCVSASAVRENFHLISVVLGAPTSNERFNDAKSLLDYGFTMYKSVDIASINEEIISKKIDKAGADNLLIGHVNNDLNIIVKRGEENKVVKKVILFEDLKLPIKKDQIIGKINVKTLEDETLLEENIYAKSEVKSLKFYNMLYNILYTFYN